eukprot:COSAG06_NODE_3749_length_4946_cov_30.291521_6_plen_326_part_00
MAARRLLGRLALLLQTVGRAARSPSDFDAVSSFAVVTSGETARRFFGPVPTGYETHVPAVSSLVRHYLSTAQTVDFCPLSDADGLACDLHGDPRAGGHKLVVLPETTVSAKAAAGAGFGADLVDFANRGGSVVVAGGALLFGEDGALLRSFATPLGSALGLEWSGTHTAIAGASVNISRTANPEWWRLLTLKQGGGGGSEGGGGSAASTSGISELQAVRPSSADTMVLATATIDGGGGSVTVPLVTARRQGERGWLVYTASSDTATIEAAVNFILAATGVFLNPGAGGLAGHAPMSLAPSGARKTSLHSKPNIFQDRLGTKIRES